MLTVRNRAMHLQIIIGSCLLVGVIFSSPVRNPAKTGIDYELLGGGYEGDMIFPDDFDPSDTKKGVAIFGPRKWPNNIIPYDISLITEQKDRDAITTAMNTLAYAVGTPKPGVTTRTSCVSFRPKQASDKVFVKLQYGTGCSASVGYSTGERRLTLQKSGCFSSGTIQHELLHVLGFYHEQSRPDRDLHLTINYANIQSGREHNFNKYVWGSTVLNQNSNYDYGSIMHYGPKSFSHNGQPTIVPKKSNVTIGQRGKLSATDVAEVRSFYGCLP